MINLEVPSGFVYAIHAVGSNYVKLGRSKEPLGRVRELQVGNPQRLNLLKMWWCEGVFCHEMERYLHNYFKEQNTSGEWFDMETSDADKIAEILTDVMNDQLDEYGLVRDAYLQEYC